MTIQCVVRNLRPVQAAVLTVLAVAVVGGTLGSAPATELKIVEYNFGNSRIGRIGR